MIAIQDGGCVRCSTVPEPVRGVGMLYLWFPFEHSYHKVVRHLAGEGRAHQARPEEGCVLVPMDGAEGRSLFGRIAGLLTSEEARETKVLFAQGARVPGVADMARVASLAQAWVASESEWLVEMLRDARVTSHFQPIVHAADTSRVFAHEALLRGSDAQGQMVPAGRILDCARGAGMLRQVDLLARRTAVREASRHGITDCLFVNFSPAAVYDPNHCLRSTMAAVDEAGLSRDRVVFEVVESERVSDTEHLRSVLQVYRGAGFRVALDDLGAGYSGLNLIHQLRPDFIKLDMELIRGVHADPYKAVIARKLLELAGEIGVPTIAEGVETVEELRWVRQAGATYVQGYLIARPGPTPVVAPPAL